MKKYVFVPFLLVIAAFSAYAQTKSPVAGKIVGSPAEPSATRPNKDQLIMAQKILNVKPTGKIDAATTAALKKFQTENQLPPKGILDVATMRKLGIGLTALQRGVPVPVPAVAPPPIPEPVAPAIVKTEPPKVAPKITPKAAPKPKNTFRATKDQIVQAQKLLKRQGLYSGKETGTVDAATSESLKKYQTANDLEATGTINQITLEKMDITVTDRQRAESELNN